MNILGGLFDILGASFAIIFVIYWACAGRILIENERNWGIKIIFFAALLVFPVFSPIVIYLVYYRYTISALRQLFKRSKQAT